MEIDRQYGGRQMTLKFRTEDNHWVFMDNIRRAEAIWPEASSPKRQIEFDIYGDDTLYKLDLPDEAYLLNDNGKTIERLA